MPRIILCTIEHECETGVMFKTQIKDAKGNPAMFAIVRSDENDPIEYQSLVLQGFCNGCGKVFEFSIDIMSMLEFKST